MAYIPKVFSDPGALCRYFKKNDSLRLQRRQFLIIDHIEQIMRLSSIEKLCDPQLKSGLFF